MIHLSVLLENGQLVGARGLLVNISPQKSAEAALTESKARYRKLAYHDHLTGLPNRVQLTEWLENALKSRGQKNKVLAVMLLDLDRFKQVVDSLGDDCGDQVLEQVSRRLKTQLRRNDILARLNGDEFALVYGNVSNPENLSLLARRLLDTLQEPMKIGQHTVYQTASIGIVTSFGSSENPASLLRQAAMAMSEAKQQGGNCFRYFCREMQDQREANFLFERHMHEALQRNEFYLHYQPQIDLANGRICGVEALVRWSGPSGDNPSPETFIKTAEESGLIHPLGDFILHEACAQNLRWQQKGLPPIQVTVNISAKQFNQPNFVDKIMQTLSNTGLAPQWLELEITESAIMSDIHEALETMRRLQEHGVHFAIDDFGTGHSSLNYLRQLALSKLKIDRSFVLDVPGNQDNEKLIFSILALARSFNLQTVAEGIETPGQLEYLRQLDCDLGQGYLFSRPVAPDAIPALLSSKCF
jgi:diguanylate cyclase (GGDEF)-like protein